MQIYIDLSLNHFSTTSVESEDAQHKVMGGLCSLDDLDNNVSIKFITMHLVIHNHISLLMIKVIVLLHIGTMYKLSEGYFWNVIAEGMVAICINNWLSNFYRNVIISYPLVINKLRHWSLSWIYMGFGYGLSHIRLLAIPLTGDGLPIWLIWTKFKT